MLGEMAGHINEQKFYALQHVRGVADVQPATMQKVHVCIRYICLYPRV